MVPSVMCLAEGRPAGENPLLPTCGWTPAPPCTPPMTEPQPHPAPELQSCFSVDPKAEMSGSSLLRNKEEEEEGKVRRASAVTKCFHPGLLRAFAYWVIRAENPLA